MHEYPFEGKPATALLLNEDLGDSGKTGQVLICLEVLKFSKWLFTARVCDLHVCVTYTCVTYTCV